jgi:hypothetical protein
VRVESIQYRPLQVGCQQGDVDLVVHMLPLRQYMVVVLKNTVLGRTLDFSGKAVFAVKTLNAGLLNLRPINRSIQGIVAVTA